VEVAPASQRAVASVASCIPRVADVEVVVLLDAEMVALPEELIKAELDASRTLEALLVSIASVSLLVEGIGVMNVMLASVVERTREIGLRLAVGAPDWAVQVQFLVEAVLLTALGGRLGWV
jgi:putative ABC transport system permease protein